ncbi:MAG: NAD(P)H-dependent oxidoreductase subunit E [Candidatus Eiseniibacteriota bacterium]|nr:MAG: NAD(P)H-dependent oxidoreductase subunit E [Candidatus Eisenbacteria bacterium]
MYFDFDKLESILQAHGSAPESLISVLEDVQDQFRFLPEEALVLIGTRIGVPVSQVYSVATFYNAFSLVPKGRHLVSVCLGTACHVKGAGEILGHLRKQMRTDSSGTTEDLEFTVEDVRCLGCCSIAPVVKVDDEVYGYTSPQKALEVLEKYKKKT